MVARELGVWLDDVHVATLRSNRPGKIECRYTAAARDTWPLNTPVLSHSLPLSRTKLDAHPFVTGLLPEGAHRQTMAALAGVPVTDVLGMLEQFGRDVAGALILSAEDPPVREPAVEPYTDAGLAQTVADLVDEHPLALHDDSELSIAGLSDKMLVVQIDAATYGRPVHGAPSTHILKVDDRIRQGLVRAEHACLTLARTAGLRASGSTLIQIGDAECVVVERFDRDNGDGCPRRLHQEDACQALGVDPDANRRHGKYESGGGPGFADGAGVLDDWGEDVDAEHAALVEAMTFTVAIGNADAHGKNVAFLHPEPGVMRLAPLYDTVPTVHWPTLRTEAGMFVNGVRDLRRITVTDLASEATRWGMPRARAERLVRETLERLRDALPHVAVGTPALDLVGHRIDTLLIDT